MVNSSAHRIDSLIQRTSRKSQSTFGKKTRDLMTQILGVGEISDRLSRMSVRLVKSEGSASEKGSAESK